MDTNGGSGRVGGRGSREAGGGNLGSGIVNLKSGISEGDRKDGGMATKRRKGAAGCGEMQGAPMGAREGWTEREKFL